jgi:hypothetical protein
MRPATYPQAFASDQERPGRQACAPTRPKSTWRRRVSREGTVGAGSRSINTTKLIDIREQYVFSLDQRYLQSAIPR